MAIRFRFKDRRKLKRISQQNLAMRLGIGQSYLNEIENNTYKRSPRVELIERIAKELGVCFMDIVECDNNCKICRHRFICTDSHLQEIHDSDEDIYFFI